jgi:hypothetical protein
MEEENTLLRHSRAPSEVEDEYTPSIAPYRDELEDAMRELSVTRRLKETGGKRKREGEKSVAQTMYLATKKLKMREDNIEKMERMHKETLEALNAKFHKALEEEKAKKAREEKEVLRQAQLLAKRGQDSGSHDDDRDRRSVTGKTRFRSLVKLDWSKLIFF